MISYYLWLLVAFLFLCLFIAGLGEYRIRDLNDEINKLLREKGHWEVRIKELGGPDYVRVGPRMTDMDGQEAPGNRYVLGYGSSEPQW